MQVQLSEDIRVQQIISDLLDQKTWLSFSSLKQFMESPKDFIDYKLKKFEQTAAMIYGAMVHCLVLEPEYFEKRYHCLDDKDICMQIGGAKPRATKAYKEWYEVAISEANGRIIVETEDYEAAKRVAIEVKTNRASSKILRLCDQREKPIEWECMNFKFKGFIDMVGEKGRGDLKTVPDANPRKVQRQIIQDGWYIQGAMYEEGDRSKKPYHITAVDRKGGVSVVEIPERLLEIGTQHYHHAVEKFNECIFNDAFGQSYDFWSERWDGLYVAEIPGYIFDR